MGPYDHTSDDPHPSHSPDAPTTSDPATPTLGPVVSVLALDQATVIQGKVVDAVSCQYTGMIPIPVASGRAYIACFTEVDAVDLATN